MSLWTPTRGGPASTSGRSCNSNFSASGWCSGGLGSGVHTHRAPQRAAPWFGVDFTTPRASIGGFGRGASTGVASDTQPTTRPGKVTIAYDEETSQDTLVPAPRGKTLKINVDLMLWRCRQARLKAQMSLDEAERRDLFKDAEAGLRRCLVLDPSDARTYVVLGKLLMMQRRFEEARVLYTEGCANTGNTNPYVWSAWGWLEFKTGNVARARQLFDAATVVDDTHACAWHKWGLLEKSEGNYTKARDLWMQGIQRCRRKPQAQNAYLFNALAVMAGNLGRLEEARAWFEEGTASLEGAASVALWQAWAVLEAKQGDARAVRYLFKKALSANPRSRYVHLAWALWERQNGNLPACLELLRRGLAMNPTDAALYQVRALVEWRDMGNPDAAARCFQAGMRADPNHLPLWQAWGCMEASRGRVETARELFQQGVWADPRSRDTVYVLHAWACLERGQGNIQLARELLKAAIKVDPKAEKVWYTWIGMEEEAGFFERAEELRIRQAEQQWEFEVPAGFTTRPGGAVAGSGSGSGQGGAVGGGLSSAVDPGVGSGAVNMLRDTLSRFFRVRDAGRSSVASPVPNSAAGPAAVPASGPSQPLTGVRSFLPSDFEGDLSLEEALPLTSPTPGASGAAAAAALDRGSGPLTPRSKTPRTARGKAAGAAARGADAAALLLWSATPAAATAGGEQAAGAEPSEGWAMQPQLPVPSTLAVDLLNSGGELGSTSPPTAREQAPAGTSRGAVSEAQGAGTAAGPRTPSPRAQRRVGRKGASPKAGRARNSSPLLLGDAPPAPSQPDPTRVLAAKPVRKASSAEPTSVSELVEALGGPDASPEVLTTVLQAVAAGGGAGGQDGNSSRQQ